MEKVDQDYLDAIMSQSNPDTSKDSKTDIKNPIETYDDIQEKAESLGRGNSALDMEIIMQFLQVRSIVFVFPVYSYELIQQSRFCLLVITADVE